MPKPSSEATAPPVGSPDGLSIATVWRSPLYYGGQTAAVLGLLFLSLQLWKVNLKVPFDYEFDVVFVLTIIKSILDHGWWWVNPNLSAPFSLEMVAFPVNNNVDLAMIWGFTRFLSGPGLVMNLFWLFSFPLAAGICAYALRQLRVSPGVAFAGGILYAFLPFHFYRIAHFTLLYHFVPFSCLTAMLLASGTAERMPRHVRGWAYLACALIGFNYFYYAFFSAFILLTGTVIGYVKTRSRPLLRIGVLAIGIIGMATMVNTLPSLHAWYKYGRPKLVEKPAGQAEEFGLKIRHLIIPCPEHTIYPFRWLSLREHAGKFPLDNENCHARLGVIMATGFIVLIAVLLFGISSDRFRLPLDLISAAQLNLATLLLSTIGGFGVIFNLLVFNEVRCYNRIVPYVAFFCLFALASLADRLKTCCQRDEKKSRLFSLGVILAVCFGVWDQQQAAARIKMLYPSSARSYEVLDRFDRKIEERFPENAMICMLPFVTFPNYMGYEHEQARPYIQSHKRMRWSWPVFSNRHCAWASALAANTPAQLLNQLALDGFDAVIVDRIVYKDRAASMESEFLNTLKQSPMVSDDGRWSVFDLRELRKKLRQPGFQNI